MEAKKRKRLAIGLFAVAVALFILMQLSVFEKPGPADQKTGFTIVTPVGYCGNGACDHGETSVSCPRDCSYQNPDTDHSGETCGNGSCAGGETCITCPNDCGVCQAVCGDYSCQSPENCNSCPDDCGTCPSICGNGVCEIGENSANCSNDCSPGPNGGNEPAPYCGDKNCNATTENSATCPSDCSSRCGDGACTGHETPENCPTDCQTGCGNLICEQGEDTENCPLDCGAAQELVLYNRTISYQKIIPEKPNQIQQRLQGMRISTSAELIEAASQNFELYRQVDLRKTQIGTYTAPSMETTVTILVRNLTASNYTEVRLVEEIPKTIVPNAGELYSPNQYKALQSDPILQFTINKIPAHGEKTITYTLPNIVLTSEQAVGFPNPILSNIQAISEEGLQKVGCKADQECAGPACYLSRCIDQECFHLRQPPGTNCGPGKECNPLQACVEKKTTPYNQPLPLLELPSLVLIAVIFALAIWVIKEYVTP